MIKCLITILVGLMSLLVLGISDCIIRGVKAKKRGKVKSIFKYLKDEW